MTEKLVIVPQSDIDAIEEARVALYEKMRLLGFSDVQAVMNVQEITEPMWKLSHRRYPTVDNQPKGDLLT